MPTARVPYTWRAPGTRATLLLLLALLAGCQSGAKRRRAFVAQYYANDFRPFQGTHFLERSQDREGNRYIGLFCPSADSTDDDLLATVVASAATDSVLKVAYVGDPHRCAQLPDSARMMQLIRRFLPYHVASLGADTSGAVAVQFRPGQFGPSDLVRIADSTLLTADFHREFSRVRGPWYERRAAN